MSPALCLRAGGGWVTSPARHDMFCAHDLIPLIDLRWACTKVKRLPLSKVDRPSAKAAYCVNGVERP